MEAEIEIIKDELKYKKKTIIGLITFVLDNCESRYLGILQKFLHAFSK